VGETLVGCGECFEGEFVSYHGGEEEEDEGC